nr:hypothetical protein [Streptomyces sp. DSM 44915]
MSASTTTAAATTTHDHDAEDGDDDLAGIDKGVPVVGHPLDGLLPPLPVLDAGVRRLLDVTGTLAGGVLPHLQGVQGQLPRGGQPLLGVVHPPAGRGGCRFGGTLVAGRRPDVVLVRRFDVVAFACALEAFGLLPRPAHPVRRVAQRGLGGGQIGLRRDGPVQGPVGHALHVLELGPVGVQRLATEGVTLLQLGQVARHPVELPAERVRRQARPVQDRAFAGHASDLAQGLADLVGELL